MFDKFQDYMYYLLISPLKKVNKSKNQYYILFKVLGKIFDKIKDDIFKVREQTMVMTAHSKVLEIHARERDMKRLKDEDIETYKKRLSMKNIIAEKAGTEEGVLLAVKSLGYEKSYIEPYYKIDSERWAEFIIYLKSKNETSINDLEVIDYEVMKVKQASSKPSYASEEYSKINIISDTKEQVFKYPVCGTLECGTYPNIISEGAVIERYTGDINTNRRIQVDYPICGEEKCGGD